METNYQELRELYRNTPTDELLHIKISSDLTDSAKSLLEQELSTRNVAPGDIEYAENVEEVLEADRESVRKDMSRRIRRFVIILVLMASIAIYFEFIH